MQSWNNNNAMPAGNYMNNNNNLGTQFGNMNLAAGGGMQEDNLMKKQSITSYGDMMTTGMS